MQGHKQDYDCTPGKMASLPSPPLLSFPKCLPWVITSCFPVILNDLGISVSCPVWWVETWFALHKCRLCEGLAPGMSLLESKTGVTF